MSPDHIFYRPQLEAESRLVEVADGCSYGACTFCPASCASRGYKIIPLDQIKRQIDEISNTFNEIECQDIFLVGSDVFSIDTEYICNIMDYIIEKISNVRRISMYARAVDIIMKSEKELLSLKERKLGDLYIGIESGDDRILQQCNKGENTDDMLSAVMYLNELNISYSFSAILGLGGKYLWKDHAISTARFFNKTRPRTIRMMTLIPWQGTVLYNDIQAGNFFLSSPLEILNEEKLLLENMNMTDCVFLATHESNILPLAGLLPLHKDVLLKTLDYAIECYDILPKSNVNIYHM